MQKSMWKKVFVLGIILLFLSAGVLPSVSGRLVELNTSNNNLNNTQSPVEKLWYIGTIEMITKNPPDGYQFIAQKVLAVRCYGWIPLQIARLRNERVYIDTNVYAFIGTMTNHFIWGYFFAE